MASRPYFYLGGGRALTRLLSGEMFFVDTDARDISPWIIHAGVWETFVDDVLTALVRRGDTFVDVGSNMGYYAIKMGGLVGPQGRVFAYEPNPRLFEVLRDNVHINGFGDRAQVFQAAAGDEAGTTSLTFQHFFPGGGAAGLGPEYAGNGREQTQVAVVRIDDTLAEGQAHLIKIDVEGFEPLVLRGMAGLLKRSPDAAVVVEVSYRQWARFGDPVQMLTEVADGRRVFRIHSDGRLSELPAGAIDQSLNRNFPSYLLLLPATAARWRQIRRFVDPRRKPDDIHALAEPPIPAPSLARRIRNRLRLLGLR